MKFLFQTTLFSALLFPITVFAEPITGIDFLKLGANQTEIMSKAQNFGAEIVPISDDDYNFYPAADPVIFQNIKMNSLNLDWVNTYFENKKLYKVEIFYSPWIANNEMGGFSFNQKAHFDFQKLLTELKNRHEFGQGVETEIFEETGGEHACDKPVILKKKTWTIQSPEYITATYVETKMLEPVSRRELSINDAATMDCQYPAEASITIYDKNIDTQVRLINDRKKLEWKQQNMD